MERLRVWKLGLQQNPQYLEQYELLQQNTVYILGQYLDFIKKNTAQIHLFSWSLLLQCYKKNNPNQNKFPKYPSMNK